MRWTKLFALFAIYTSAFATIPPADTVEKVVSPYPGSFVRKSQSSRYERFTYPLDAETIGFNRQRKLRELEGDVRHTFYQLPKEVGELEAYRNYRDAMLKAGLTVVHDVTGEALGFAHNVARYLEFPCYDPKNSESHLIAGEKNVSGVLLHVLVFTAACNNEGTRAGVWVVEGKPMRTDQVKMSADDLARHLEESGSVSIYGIEFDFDKAVLRSTSTPTLEEIAKLLKKKPALKLFVVGHTDMDGALDYNMTLSNERAAAVVNWLASHGIAKKRLTPKGLGPLAPKSTNRSDSGRALNRRVELVERS